MLIAWNCTSSGPDAPLSTLIEWVLLPLFDQAMALASWWTADQVSRNGWSPLEPRERTLIFFC